MPTTLQGFVALRSSSRSPISKALSFPLKASELDHALSDVPQTGLILLRFRGAWRLSRDFARTGRYLLLRACYSFNPRFSPDQLWEISVEPVPRELRSTASQLLSAHGLPNLKAWFIEVAPSSGMEGSTSFSIALDPAGPALIQESFPNLLPRVRGHA